MVYLQNNSYITHKIINNKFIDFFKDRGLCAPSFFRDKNDVKGGLESQIIKKIVRNEEFCMIFAVLMQILEPSLI